MQDGGINKLGEGDLEVACMKERMGENKVESQADSYVDKILIAANSLLWSSSLISSALSPTPSPPGQLPP